MQLNRFTVKSTNNNKKKIATPPITSTIQRTYVHETMDIILFVFNITIYNIEQRLEWNMENSEKKFWAEKKHRIRGNCAKKHAQPEWYLFWVKNLQELRGNGMENWMRNWRRNQKVNIEQRTMYFEFLNRWLSYVMLSIKCNRKMKHWIKWWWTMKLFQKTIQALGNDQRIIKFCIYN